MADVLSGAPAGASTPTIYFVRHGQTDWNRETRIQGSIDVPINAKGRTQALRNAGVLAELIDTPGALDFVCSPLSRTRETMEIIRAQLGLARIGYTTDARLAEITFGVWQGRTWSELRADAAIVREVAARDADPFNYRPDGGESYADLTARVLAWFHCVRRDTVVVSHGGVSRALRVALQGLPPQEVATLPAPQDKVLMIAGGTCDWV